MDKKGCISEFRNASPLLTAPRSRFLESMVISATIMIAQAVRTTADQVSRNGLERKRRINSSMEIHSTAISENT